MCYSYPGQFRLFTLAKLLVSAYCCVRLQKSGLASAFQRNVTVCISICLQVLYVWWASTRRGMNWPTKKSPPSLVSSLHLIFFCLLIPTLPQYSCLGAAQGKQSQRKCDNRGINQMYIELAWLTELMWCFYTPDALWIGLLLWETPLCALRVRVPFTGSCDPGAHRLCEPHLWAHSSSFS